MDDFYSAVDSKSGEDEDALRYSIEALLYRGISPMRISLRGRQPFLRSAGLKSIEARQGIRQGALRGVNRNKPLISGAWSC